MSQQLALRDFDERRNEVLVHFQSIDAVGERTECDSAVGDLHDRRPSRRPQGLPC